VGYSLLAMALENITGIAFDDIFANDFVRALNLTGTYSLPPSDQLDRSFVPYNLSYSGFLWQTFSEAPAAGFVSLLLCCGSC
jgi:CubicO group peptidase (beta-lactamase class C family)